MNIVFIAPRFHTNQYCLSRSLVGTGHHVDFLVIQKDGIESYEYVVPEFMKQSLISKALCRIRVCDSQTAAGKKRIVRYFAPSFLYLVKKFKETAPDIIIYRDRNRSTLIAFFVARLLGVRVNILYDQNPVMVNKRPLGFRQRIIRGMYPRVRISPVLYRNDRNEKDFIEGLTPEKHSYFVPFVTNVLQLPDQHSGGMNNGVLRILDVGKFREYKNHYFVVDAIEQFARYHKVLLTIIGQALDKEEIKYYLELEKYIQRKGLENIVTLEKNLVYKEMNDIYGFYDVLVLASKYEVAGAVVYEAMANGLPVITTSANGTASYVRDGVTGYVYLAGVQDDLVRKLNTFYNHWTDGDDMKYNCIKHVRGICSFEAYMKTLSLIVKTEFGDPSISL